MRRNEFATIIIHVGIGLFWSFFFLAVVIFFVRERVGVELENTRDVVSVAFISLLLLASILTPLIQLGRLLFFVGRYKIQEIDGVIDQKQIQKSFWRGPQHIVNVNGNSLKVIKRDYNVVDTTLRYQIRYIGKVNLVLSIGNCSEPDC